MWHRKESVASFVDWSNKRQLLSKEQRLREADFAPPWRKPQPRKRREIILVTGMITLILISGALLLA